MEFFKKVKIRLKIRRIICAIISAAFAVAGMWSVVNNGFSSDTDSKISLRGMRDFGVPVPNWLVSFLFCIFTAGAILFFIYSFKQIIKDSAYNDMIDAVKKMGDVDYIGNYLSSLPKSPYAKGGDLRYSNLIFFYFKDTDIYALHPASITNIQPVNRRVKDKIEYYVYVYVEEEKIEIRTTKENNEALCKNIIETFYAQQTPVNAPAQTPAPAPQQPPVNAPAPQQNAGKDRAALDDYTFIREIKCTSVGAFYQYDILLAAKGYGWDFMKNWADYMVDADLRGVSEVNTGALGEAVYDITSLYLNNGKRFEQIPQLNTEQGFLSVAGMSKTLGAPMKIMWINQTCYLRFITPRK